MGGVEGEWVSRWVGAGGWSSIATHIYVHVMGYGRVALRSGVGLRDGLWQLSRLAADLCHGGWESSPWEARPRASTGTGTIGIVHSRRWTRWVWWRGALSCGA